MTANLTFLKRHSVLTYFIVTFAISWGGVLILGAPYGIPTTSEQFEVAWPIVFLPYFLGPSISSILLISLTHGKVGLRELLSRLLRWRVGITWYAVALLTAPLLVLIVLLPLSLISPVYLPGIITSTDKIGLILSGILVGLIFGGLLEELGWTGFSVPELRRHYGVLATGIIVGFLWGVWHFLPTYWGSGDSTGSLSLSQFLPPCLFYVGVLPAYRVFMVWVYDRTGRSLLVLMLMHMSLTASTLFILAPSAEGVSLIIYYFILAALMWIIVVVMAKTKGAKLERSKIG